MTEPLCPSCSIAGVEHIVSTASTEKAKQGTPWFYVAHCDQCGHVYGVFTKHVFGRTGPQLIVERPR
jgi:uncharacterized Zn finger protein